VDNYLKDTLSTIPRLFPGGEIHVQETFDLLNLAAIIFAKFALQLFVQRVEFAAAAQ
jgi:hypothetical protein